MGFYVFFSMSVTKFWIKSASYPVLSETVLHNYGEYGSVHNEEK